MPCRGPSACRATGSAGWCPLREVVGHDPRPGNEEPERLAPVPIVTDEQRALLAYALKHAAGTEGKLFGHLHRLWKGLTQACRKLNITVVSPHDLRRSAGQWLVDIGTPLELVSKFMRHANTHITETVYASVRQGDVADRILDAIDPRYAQQANKDREKPLVQTLTSIPEPRQLALLYKVNGDVMSLDAWADGAGIPKGTLYYRVVTRGMPMAEALKKGTPGQRRASKPAPPCDGGVISGMETTPPDGPNEPVAGDGPPLVSRRNFGFIGAPGRTRTCDQRLRSAGTRMKWLVFRGWRAVCTRRCTRPTWTSERSCVRPGR